jgi:hypothetical protein
MNLTDAVVDVFQATLSRVEDLDSRFLLPALGLQLGTLVFKSLAWRNVLAAAYPSERVSTFGIGCSYVAGVALNAFAPARGGEVAKIVLARTQIPRSTLPTIAGALSLVVMLDALLGLLLASGLWAGGIAPGLPLRAVVDKAPIIALVCGTLGIALAVCLRARPGVVRAVISRAAAGARVLRSPRRYLRAVVPFQLAALGCRIGVVFLVLGAFHIHAGLETAALLVVLGGLSTAVPVPGGVGAQQVLATFALQGIVSAAGAVSFSLGLQVGITFVNTVIGLAGAMILFRTIRPLTAVRAVRATVSDRRLPPGR